MARKLFTSSGYSLIELVVVVVIIGILATIAFKSMRATTDTARTEETKRRLEKIGFAIGGDPTLVSGGVRTNYGYVGDVGGMPSNLDALITNPGGYTTWKGPYIQDDLSPDGTNARFKNDGWGKAIVYSGGVTVASSGGPISITRSIAPSQTMLLYNQVAVTITDFALSSPGTIYRDSVKALLDVPNGIGGVTVKTKFPAADGYLKFDSIPIGQRLLRIVYTPNNDTLRRQVHVDPGTVVSIDAQLFRKVW